MSGYEVCPGASPGCRAACLHFAGSPAYYDNKTKARIAKTKAFFQKRQAFMNLLALELHSHVERCKKKGVDPAMRLNATSDIRWEVMRFELYDWVKEKIGRSSDNIIDLFLKECPPYDYTKLSNRKVPDGYHLTFSASENNPDATNQAIKLGRNVAVVFADKLPDVYLGLPVVDGDETDYRPADPKNVIVGLKVKGSKGKSDATGFAVRL